ncbi:S-adenosylhomocysteine deaminase, Methylthioadenosine deaminase [Methylophaga frappieri]|uniref:5-methylthioadenosine/S-adenosylhomocysteine deaminase n=1 Tax=Methylophaga frappieri (strain ATCC BAA-2434 / DSM 25690 / JAM7) TaxID=754477 RepID=I1YGW0_METFJ|nr:TRZ/ATZ family hydrolase [Methylophaga frappieri]AFJ02153.1 S-adenosylhomocysteine deaminase, Methylthioadenosine deaminase [Methylophaga frappieri]
MKAIDLLIHARWCLPMTGSTDIFEHYALAVHQGHIVALLPQDQADQQFTATQVHRLDDHVLMPGLINNHGHSAMTLFRGLADDLPLMQWLHEHIWPAEQRFVGDAFVEAGSALAVAEMLRGGTTTFSDMYFFPEATARVVDRTGIRASLGMVVIQFPTNWASDVNEYLHKGQALHDKYRHHPRITTNYAPHAPYTVDDATLAQIMVNAEELDVPIQMHIHETVSEIQTSIDNYGKRPLARLKELGLLSPRLIATHMTQLLPEEIADCARAGVHIAHCPESNMKLASGFSPIDAMHQAGLNITIGTDGAASNNDLDMFAEMRQTALLAKAVSGNPSAVPAYSALEMATINGAKALGIAETTGSLAVGKAADMIAVELTDIESVPMYDLASQLVYATGRDKVTDAWVAGKHVLKQKQLTTLDASKILSDAQQWAKTIKASS